jgi:hypothetical protein
MHHTQIVGYAQIRSPQIGYAQITYTQIDPTQRRYTEIQYVCAYAPVGGNGCLEPQSSAKTLIEPVSGSEMPLETRRRGRSHVLPGKTSPRDRVICFDGHKWPQMSTWSRFEPVCGSQSRFEIRRRGASAIPSRNDALNIDCCSSASTRLRMLP